MESPKGDPVMENHKKILKPSVTRSQGSGFGGSEGGFQTLTSGPGGL